jgi:hypothetical protein
LTARHPGSRPPKYITNIIFKKPSRFECYGVWLGKELPAIRRTLRLTLKIEALCSFELRELFVQRHIIIFQKTLIFRKTDRSSLFHPVSKLGTCRAIPPFAHTPSCRAS